MQRVVDWEPPVQLRDILSQQGLQVEHDLADGVVLPNVVVIP